MRLGARRVGEEGEGRGDGLGKDWGRVGIKDLLHTFQSYVPSIDATLFISLSS